MTSIRKGTISDVENISALLVEAWQNSFREFIPETFLDNLSLEKQVARHTKYMERNTNYYVVENNQKELLGFASIGPNRIKKINCNLELYAIYLKSKIQGIGIGRNLLERILHYSSSKEDSIIVSVFDKNPFKLFYTKNGFSKIGDEIINMGEFNLASSIYKKMLK